MLLFFYLFLGLSLFQKFAFATLSAICIAKATNFADLASWAGHVEVRFSEYLEENFIDLIYGCRRLSMEWKEKDGKLTREIVPAARSLLPCSQYSTLPRIDARWSQKSLGIARVNLN